MKILPLFIAFLSSIMPVIMQKKGLSSRYSFKIKMLCAFMYLITGLVSTIAIYNITIYSVLILIALVAGILGDFFLSVRNDRYFPVGIVFFALGHIIYIPAFMFTGSINFNEHTLPVTITAILLFIPVAYIIKTKLNLGKLIIPVFIYAFILLFFFTCSIANGIVSIVVGNLSYGLCMIIGGLLFVSSDIMLGLKTGGIKLPKILCHAVSYTYFPAQTLFALSIYFQ